MAPSPALCTLASLLLQCAGIWGIEPLAPEGHDDAEAYIHQARALDRHLEALYEAKGHRLRRSKDGVRMLAGLQTGATVELADLELFVRLCDLVRPRRIFAVGNAFGFSTLALSYACSNAPLDVIDAEFDEGGGVSRGLGHNARGNDLTHLLAQAQGRDVRVFAGTSPRHTRFALRGENGTYDLVFIDGKHTDRQMVADFYGIRRAMGRKAVAVFHDVGMYGMWRGVERVLHLLRTYPGATYRSFSSAQAHNKMGTGFVYWGFPPGVFDGFGPAHPARS